MIYIVGNSYGESTYQQCPQCEEKSGSSHTTMQREGGRER